MQGSEPIDRPELYIQTEMKDLRIDGPFPSARCDGEENSTDVVSRQQIVVITVDVV